VPVVGNMTFPDGKVHNHPDGGAETAAITAAIFTVTAGKPANGEGGGNGENHSGNGNSFHGYRTHLWPGKMLSAENLPYPNAN